MSIMKYKNYQTEFSVGDEVECVDKTLDYNIDEKFILEKRSERQGYKYLTSNNTHIKGWYLRRYFRNNTTNKRIVFNKIKRI